jgi:hypothetical protein
MATLELLLLLTKHLVLIGLPMAAGSLLAAHLGERRVPVLLAVALATTGVAGLLGFWAFYGGSLLGQTFAALVPLGSAVLIAWVLWERRLDHGLLLSLATPLALWALGSAFLIFLGFLHGGTDDPLVTAMSRFSHMLPGDNYLPLYFAEWFLEHGHHGTPPDYASFLSSDRPPLQIGYALLQHPFGWSGGQLSYQVEGVLLQQLWIVGLWALLLATRLERITRVLTSVAVLLSSLAIVNGFFVWPKMLPAAMLLAAAALVMTPLWDDVRRRLWGAALVAVLCALALLSHGSSVFGVIPLVAVAAWRGIPSWRWLGVAAAVGVVLMGSWSTYQKYGDPPGDRLTKWTLAGFTGIDDRGVGETIIDAYEEAGFDGVVDNKVDNFEAMAGGRLFFDGTRAALEGGDLEVIVLTLRIDAFFYLLPSMGLLLLAPFAMAAMRRRRREPAAWSLALSCFAVFAIGAVAWGLILFGNFESRAIVHVSSYLLPLLGIVGGVVGLRSVLPRFSLWYVGIGAALSLALYAPALAPPEGTSYSAWAIVLAAVALVGFIWLALRGRDGEPDRKTASTDPGQAAI